MESANAVFGLSVVEWSVLIAALIAFVGAVREKLCRGHEKKKVQVLIEAIEETGQSHPGAGRIAKRLARDKATKLGVQASSLLGPGLDDDVGKATNFRLVPRTDGYRGCKQIGQGGPPMRAGPGPVIPADPPHPPSPKSGLVHRYDLE